MRARTKAVVWFASWESVGAMLIVLLSLPWWVLFVLPLFALMGMGGAIEGSEGNAFMDDPDESDARTGP